MKLLILQIENRSDELLKSFIAWNAGIARMMDAEHVFLNISSYKVPQYWWKVFELERIMLTRPDVDLVLWLDSDAFLNPSADFDQTRRLIDRLAVELPGHSMWTSPDAPPRYHSAFCAGAFLVRNDDHGRYIMKTWGSLYNPDRWTQQADQDIWKTLGPFGGPDYEQGAFIDRILAHPTQYHVCQLPFYVFNETNCIRAHPLCISVHLAGDYKHDLGRTCENALVRRSSLVKEHFGSSPPPSIVIIIASAVLLVSISLAIMVAMYRREGRIGVHPLKLSRLSKN